MLDAPMLDQNANNNVTHLKSNIMVRQLVYSMIAKQMNIQIVAPFNRLQLPVAGTSDGYANTNSAELLTNCFIDKMIRKSR